MRIMKMETLLRWSCLFAFRCLSRRTPALLFCFLLVFVSLIASASNVGKPLDHSVRKVCIRLVPNLPVFGFSEIFDFTLHASPQELDDPPLTPPPPTLHTTLRWPVLLIVKTAPFHHLVLSENPRACSGGREARQGGGGRR